jgi:hypothetical protein
MDAQNYSLKGNKLQWLQYPSEINVDNLDNLRSETSRHYRYKKEEISDIRN